MKLNNNFYLQTSLVAFFANINLATGESRFSIFRFLVPLLHSFIMRKRKPFKIGPQQSSTKVCFDENKQTHAFFTGKLSGHSDLPESVLKWVSQSSARYHCVRREQSSGQCAGLWVQRSGFKSWLGHDVVSLSKTLHSHCGGCPPLGWDGWKRH